MSGKANMDDYCQEVPLKAQRHFLQIQIGWSFVLVFQNKFQKKKSLHRVIQYAFNLFS